MRIKLALFTEITNYLKPFKTIIKPSIRFW